MKILFLSAEVAPFAKTGGLADVCGSLPKALHALGHEVRVVMPAYRPIEHGYHTDNPFGLAALPGELRVPTGAGTFPAGVLHGRLPGSPVPVYFIAEWNLFGREKIYGYEDDPYRFAFFSRAVFELLAALDWHPDVLHAHDWHAAPAITWLATAGQSDPRWRNLPSLYTIHNLAYQGQARWEIFDYLQLLTHSLAEEPYGWVNFMARGIYHANQVNTVSPTYAREITTPEFGEGLDRLLRARGPDLHGILNGIDTGFWNPASDPVLAQHYHADDLAGKAACKRDLQARAGLPQRENVPLVAMVTRLTGQKGLDITGHVIHKLLNNHAGDEAQFVVLGTGDAEYEAMFGHLAGYHRRKMTAWLKYDAQLAQRIYAGADIFLMPSRFEPCGLGQMIAMRYGAVPVVRATGGLADTVQHEHTGFTFTEYSTAAFWRALDQALQVYYHDKTRWREIQRNGMTADFSWEKSARAYVRVYAGCKA